MRTTLTLDDDVAYALKKTQASSPGKPFKEIVNEVLRRGLEAKPASRGKRFRVKAQPIGLRADLNFDNIDEVLDILDGPNRR